MKKSIHGPNSERDAYPATEDTEHHFYGAHALHLYTIGIAFVVVAIRVFEIALDSMRSNRRSKQPIQSQSPS